MKSPEDVGRRVFHIGPFLQLPAWWMAAQERLRLLFHHVKNSSQTKRAVCKAQ